MNLKKEKELKREQISKELFTQIKDILFLLKTEDLKTLNERFINKQIGFYEIYKTDVENKITFKHEYSMNEITELIGSFEIKEEQVNFNCSPYNDALYGWDKEGVFLTADIKPYISMIKEKENILGAKEHKKEELENILLIEKTSYEIIITDNIIFYFTKIGNNWYITLIDNLKTDCSQ